MGMLSLFGPMFDGIFNLGSTIYGNNVMRERAGEAVSFVDQLNTDLDAERGAWMNPDLYGGMLDPGRFGAGQFASSVDFGKTLQDMLSDYQGSGKQIDSILGQGRSDIEKLLQGERGDPMAVARAAGGFVSDLGLDSYLRAGAGDISAASRDRLGRGSQDLIASTLSSGRSLADSRDAMNAMRYGEDIARSSAMDQLQAGAEGLRNQNMQFRAGLQNQAMLNQIATNAGLAQAQAGHIAGLAGQRAGYTSEMGQLAATARQNLAGMQFEAEDRDQAQAFDAYQAMLGYESQNNMEAYNRAMDFLGMKQQNMLTQAGFLSGTPFTIPQTTIGRDMAQNQMQMAQLRQSQKASAQVSILGTGGGGGCIDAESVVITRDRGAQPVADVLPGDQVRGEDGRYHQVVGKDCGTVAEELRHDMVQIAVAGALIRATPDHIIEGKPAGQWRPGEKLRVDGQFQRIESVMLSPWSPSADLILEGNVPYVANGFVVHSNIGRNGLEAWRRHLAEQGRTENGLIFSNANPLGVWAVAA